jgi:tungstate transport system ATP-binding protein
MSPIYTLDHVGHSYGDRSVVDIKHLEVLRQEVVAVVGPSGAGKSTLLRLLAFLERPSRGSIVYAGRKCDDQWPDLAARRSVTMVFQKPYLLHRTVLENVAYGLELRGQGNNEGRISRMLEQLGLADLAQARAHTLSGGEMERVALARALVLRPEVLLLDEPTANLDPFNIRLIENIVTRANQKHGVTVVMVTHNTFQARRLAHRVALMLAGNLVEVAETERFFEQPAKPESAAFVRGDIIY